MEKSEALSPARFRPCHSLLEGLTLLESLPNEIVFRIFAYVAPRDLLALSSVCRSLWNLLEGNEILWGGHLDSRALYYASCLVARGQNAKETYFKSLKLHKSWVGGHVSPQLVRGYYKPIKHLRIDAALGIFANASDNIIEAC